MSSLLVAKFTLDLRQANAKIVEASSVSLPPIQSPRDVLYRMHQSMLTEMGDHEDATRGNEVSASQNGAEGPQDPAVFA